MQLSAQELVKEHKFLREKLQRVGGENVILERNDKDQPSSWIHRSHTEKKYESGITIIFD